MSLASTDPVRARIAVGLPVRNGASYLAGALANLTSQDVDGLVVVVNDNDSTDATGDIARDIASSDPRVHYRRHPRNLGANQNFNDVFRACRSDFFKWAAVDDLCDDHLIARSVAILEARPGVVLAYGHPRLIDEHGAVLTTVVEENARAAAASPVERFRDVLLHEVWCTPVFGVVRSAALAQTPLLRPFYGADKVLLAELALVGRFERVEDAGFYRRCHEEQSTVLDAREKAVWTTGASSARSPDVLRALRAYVSVAASADLANADRARAVAAVGRLAVGGDKLRKLLLPGPYNYFGWRGSRPRSAYGSLDLTPTGTSAPGHAGSAPNVPPTSNESGDAQP